MEDMTSVPNPHAARGDAKLVGKTLVAQGHAIEVPYAQRKRGDVICYEYGEYGHIATQLSGGRVFEQNVNLGGVQSKIVDGQRVYASRIGSENEAWRVGKNPHVYRIKSYNEGVFMNEEDLRYLHILGTGAEPGKAFIDAFKGKPPGVAIDNLLKYSGRVIATPEGLKRLHRLATGSNPGTQFIAAFSSKNYVEAITNLEKFAGSFVNKPAQEAVVLKPGTYKVN